MEAMTCLRFGVKYGLNALMESFISVKKEPLCVLIMYLIHESLLLSELNQYNNMSVVICTLKIVVFLQSSIK